jgi:hypothetical protein
LKLFLPSEREIDPREPASSLATLPLVIDGDAGLAAL